jgi:acyl-CoA thioester hydrolase
MAPYLHPVTVRYLEVDQQGVVFNAWYLAYFDDALTGFLADRGFPYAVLMAAGCDVQLVHTELDWSGSLGFGDAVTVAVRAEKVGTTSFTLAFEVAKNGVTVCSARTVYVVIGLDGSGKRPIPPLLRAALSSDLSAEGSLSSGGS